MAKRTKPTPPRARKWFRTEGVVVNYPGLSKAVTMERLKLPALGALPTVKGGFKPFRLVINFKVMDATTQGKIVSDFEPPIEVRFRYTYDDLAMAEKEGKPLSLGDWDGKKWIRYTPETHGLKMVPDPNKKYAGWGIIRVSHWEDPPQAWGT